MTISSTSTNRTALDAAPIAIWQEDFSGIARFCEKQRVAGIEDMRAHLEHHPFVLADLVGTIRVTRANEMAATVAGAADKADLLGPIAPELFSDATWDTFLDQVLAIWEGRDRLTTESVGSDFAGNPTWHKIHWAAPTTDGVVDYTRVLVMLEDTTDHHLAQRQREANERGLRALIDIGGQLASTRDQKRVFQHIADTVQRLTGADESIIILFDQESAGLTAVADASHIADLTTLSYDEVMDGISGWVATRQEPALVSNMTTDPRNGPLARVRLSRFPAMSAAVVPIVRNDVVIGTLTALNGPDSPAFVAGQLALIETLASQAAVAIHNARIHEELQRNHDKLQSAHRELQETQTQLLHAQKMESIGSLAAGIAHEINTPIQYVGDNVRFLKESADAVFGLMDTIQQLLSELETDPAYAERLTAYRTAAAETDLEFIMEETPVALEQTLEGVTRVADIVRAMKEFAHPGSGEKSPVDLNHSIETTAAVARNEWKYVADLELDLDPDLPMVPALAGPLNQSLLVIIVNAAQALGGSIDDTAGEKGSIRISTTMDGSNAEIRISDNGPGIPADIVDRIFDPFFTTKDVGKGSGQGLSIARSVVVDKHCGRLDVETELGVGTTFIIRLPSKCEKDS